MKDSDFIVMYKIKIGKSIFVMLSLYFQITSPEPGQELCIYLSLDLSKLCLVNIGFYIFCTYIYLFLVLFSPEFSCTIYLI